MADEVENLSIRNGERLLESHPHLSGVLLAVLIGLLGGLGAIFFRELIGLVQRFFYGSADDAIEYFRSLPRWRVLLAPAAGGLVVGPLVWFLAREARGHGVPEVMEAVAMRGGRIRKRVAVVKALASAICIGSGGSVGREGPIVQIGSAIGSTLGQILKVSAGRMRTFVGCGAAAGIAATFNAPIAGAMFALEVIVGEYRITTFSPIVVSSVIATVVSRAYFENVPAFLLLEKYALASPFEIPLYMLLGLAAALLSVLFTKTLYFTEDLFDSLKPIPPWARAAIGGLLLGALALWMPHVLGNGYYTIELALGKATPTLALLGLLVALKVVATSITLGTGGSGGIFAPSLFLGAVGGAAFGVAAGRIMPDSMPVAGPGAYALVGMGAVVAGTTHAPISAIIIIFELTGDYRIILPLMLACVISTLVSSRLSRGSIYTLKLTRRGLNIRAGRDVDLLRSIRVREVMHEDVITVSEKDPIHTLVDRIAETRHLTFPVLDDEEKLTGVVSHHDYREVLQDEALQNLVLVGEVATRTVITVHPEDTLSHALRLIGDRDIETIPVVNTADRDKVVGIVTRRDIITAYRKALAAKALEPP